MRTRHLARVPYRRWAGWREGAGFAVLVAFVLCAAAWAAPTTLVKDLNPQPYQAGSSGPVIERAAGREYAPYSATELADALFFAAWDEINGTELWSLNSRSGVYALVKDINPGRASSNPHDLITINGRLFFAAADGSYGDELWTSDGSADGTRRVKDVQPGPDGAAPVALTNASGTLFFVAQHASEPAWPGASYGSWELWKSDGTEAGTVRVKAFSPFSYYTSPTVLSVGGMVFFTAEAPGYGRELWKSDGTEAGTIMVKDINPGPDSSFASYLTDLNGTLIFSASDGSHGQELWRSDGTENGTVLIRDINPGPAGAFPVGLTAMNGSVLFSADDGVSGNELWKTDGIPTNTQLIKDLTPGPVGSALGHLTRVNGTLFFIIGQGTVYPLWKSDGTTGGTELVSIINPGTSSYLDNFTAGNGALFFTPSCGSAICPLWKSDGTAAGTGFFTSLPGSINNLMYLSGKLFFSVRDANGVALWRSDGTPAGTIVIKPTTLSQGSSELYRPTTLHGSLFFLLDGNSSGRELWRSDGTDAGTVLLKTGVTNGPILVGQKIFFSVAAAELWASDGTPAGTVRVKDFSAPSPDESIALESLASLNGRLIFSLHNYRSNGAPTVELWISDGTPDGTKHVGDVIGGGAPYGLAVNDFTNVNGTAFFSVIVTRPYDPCSNELASSSSALIWPAASATSSYALWKSDGTVAGTKLVKRFGCSFSGMGMSTPPALMQLTNLQGTLFFSARATGASAEANALWKSDGTSVGTVKVAAVTPNQLTAVDRTLFFTADDGMHGSEVWKSNGTTEGTMLVKDILPGPSASAPAQLTAVDRALFFTASDGNQGTELWQSDGTAAGTALVKDIWPGPEGAAPTELADVNGTLVFRATDGVAGHEPWRTDGTTAGTALIRDIAPGKANSNAAQFTFAATQLFFSANDGITGRELWAIRSAEAEIPSNGGQLIAWMDHTTYTFPPASVSAPAIVTHTIRMPDTLPAPGDRVQIYHAFEVAAVDRATGQVIQPARPYTVTIQYTDAQRGVAIANTLALYSWDGHRWVQEASSRVNPSTHTITATPQQVGLWAVLGETRRWFLPLAHR